MNKSAFHLASKAIFEEDLAGLSAAIAGGLDIHQEAAHGNTLLRNAAMNDNSAPLRLLLEMGANPNQRINYRSPVDKRFEAGFTPLMYASTAEAALTLIGHGADVNLASDSGMTALMRASDEDTARVLIENGAAVDAVNQAGTSALMFASNSGHAEVVRLLLGKGANFSLRQNKRRGKKAYTALELAKDGLSTWEAFSPDQVNADSVLVIERYRRSVAYLSAAIAGRAATSRASE